MNPREMDLLVRMSRAGTSVGIAVVHYDVSVKSTQAGVTPMSHQVEKVTRVGGVELSKASDDRLIAMIKDYQAQKKALTDLGIEGEYIAHQIGEIDKALNEVAAELNSRAKQ